MGNVISGPSTSKVGDVGNKLGDVGQNTQTSNLTGTLSNGSASGSSVGDTKSSSGGNVVSGGATSSDSSNRVDASTHSSYKAIFIPPVVPGTPASYVATGNIVQQVSACGPRQTLIRTTVTGAYMGLFRTTQINQGWTEDLADAPVPYLDVPLADGRAGYTRYGHQVFMTTTVIGLGGARNLAIGGGGGNGSWGQGGGGSSSSTQRLVNSIQLRTCEIGTVVNQPVELPIETRAIHQ